MRVTAEAKAATKQRILDVARQLFATSGFEAATTRDIADAAGIASGTLFNYFPTKEAILAALAADAVAGTGADFDGNHADGQSFEEDLFAFVAASMRSLKPLRKNLAAVLETALNPLSESAGDEVQELRTVHLATVAQIAKQHSLGELPPFALQLYWTLYTGVLVFWTKDRSAKQEDTLALLDRSLAMFVGWLQNETGNVKGGDRSCPRR